MTSTSPTGRNTTQSLPDFVVEVGFLHLVDDNVIGFAHDAQASRR